MNYVHNHYTFITLNTNNKKYLYYFVWLQWDYATATLNESFEGPTRWLSDVGSLDFETLFPS